MHIFKYLTVKFKPQGMCGMYTVLCMVYFMSDIVVLNSKKDQTGI